MAESMSSDEDSNWVIDLETNLLGGLDLATLRSICKGRPVPDHLRAEVWQICLGVDDKIDALSSFDELFNLPEQSIIRERCHSLVEKLGNEDDQIGVCSDLESIITFFCKSRNVQYNVDNGWVDVLQPMLALNMSKSDLFNCFYALLTKYIPNDCGTQSKAFHLFRLLLLYHDPELCSFLDTLKISPDLYARKWFCTLFSSNCDLNVMLKMWDVYLQNSDPFLVFFLALVIIVNAKEQILSLKSLPHKEILENISVLPSGLNAEDIEDFCGLAQHYSSKTPQSFRRDYHDPLFGLSMMGHKDDRRIEQALCLPVAIDELLQFKMESGDGVRFFVVDCRPAEQYNAGHLSIARHLDSNLMMQSPHEFATAVKALCSSQRHAVSSGSSAGGEHLCFMGSGREQEDQYVNMVVANFLQKHSQFVSVARGGYLELHETIEDRLNTVLANHNPKLCIVCNPEVAGSDLDNCNDFVAQGDSMMTKLSHTLRSKSAVMKERFSSYIKNESLHGVSSVKNKSYRDSANVFSIMDDEEDPDGKVEDNEESQKEVIRIETWLHKPDVLHTFQCQQVNDNGYMLPSHLLITRTHLYVLQEIPNKKGMAWIQNRRSLSSIVKITSKKKHPELITFKYGSNVEDSGPVIVAHDRFYIPKAGEATKVVKQQIMKIIENEVS